MRWVGSHAGGVDAIVVAGRLLVSAGRDGVLRTWGGSSPFLHVEEAGWVHRLAARDGELVGVTTRGDLLRWRGDQLARTRPFQEGATDVVVTGDGLVVAAGDFALVGVDAAGVERFRVATARRPYGLFLAGDARTATYCTEDARVGEVDLATGARSELAHPLPPAAYLAVSRAAGALFVAAGERLWCARPQGAEARVLGPLFALATSPDGRWLAAGGDGGVVHVLDAATGGSVAEERITGAPLPLGDVDDTAIPPFAAQSGASSSAAVTALRFAPDSRLLFVGTIGGDVLEFDVPA